ncbi:2-oxo acid dehydrogenase subunit E2 [Nonomuraea rhodomycinica]|uniref:Dihydrolipoamide acetyltransferase component of pyruvate dehydrogenase complex n=1 Tax=Nonomuraea rhodomycinica TaxID=1712872 RepID=A0A7Y6INY5_9ACTN|nr:2-oxo acid dehydrogenase subunit E2 [Nonomuraea rhodomycinica]NUW41365.1 2-oxo acid dehydrogenase subunit E2 [Nonomuraea rhodomycinica]
MGELRVPKLNNNDSEYTLLEWLAADGAPVRREEPVATLETSKAVEELTAEQDGTLTHLLAQGAVCRPGDLLARITSGDAEPAVPFPAPTLAEKPGGPIITAPAQDLIDSLGLDPALVRTLDVKVVRRADVERLAASGSSASQAALSVHQRAVGRTVTLSHRTIPAAYTAIKVDVGAALTLTRDLTRRLRKLVGLPDLLIAAVASLHDKHPMFFAELVDEATAAVPETPAVGVTIDLGTGLYVPVVRGRPGLAEIAETMTAFRRHAQHGTFKEADLRGANIAVTLHHDPDIVLAIPIIAPGHACALALASPQPEGDRTVATIGLAYDHRLNNGRDAVLFLQALKESLESPEGL